VSSPLKAQPAQAFLVPAHADVRPIDITFVAEQGDRINVLDSKAHANCRSPGSPEQSQTPSTTPLAAHPHAADSARDVKGIALESSPRLAVEPAVEVRF
jgi:hypothetical protein